MYNICERFSKNVNNKHICCVVHNEEVCLIYHKHKCFWNLYNVINDLNNISKANINLAQYDHSHQEYSK